MICMSKDGCSDPACITVNITSDVYIEALETVLLSASKTVVGPNWFFKQDSARPHVSKQSMRWSKEQNINFMEWLTCSPDLNVI